VLLCPLNHDSTSVVIIFLPYTSLNQYLGYSTVNTCFLVTSSACLVNYLKGRMAVLCSETLLVLTVQGYIFSNIAQEVLTHPESCLKIKKIEQFF
jgi:hypothetical protein